MTCLFEASASIKDTIENAGVPHPEIDLILVNSVPVDFNYRLQGGEYVSIYPLLSIKGTAPGQLCQNDSIGYGFLVDLNLSKLARYLRMLGLNSLLAEHQSDAEIAALAAKTNRVLLTRDTDLLKHKVIRKGYWVRSYQPEEQIREVFSYFDLRSSISPFTRCIVCNRLLEPVEKEKIKDLVEPLVYQYYNEYWICGQCRKVYWNGPHYHRMLSFIAEKILPMDHQEGAQNRHETA